MGKTGGGTGTNQYQVRGSSSAGQRGHSATPSADAMLSAGYRRCGEVWGTECPKLVSYPNWSHDKHPSTRSKENIAKSQSTPSIMLQDLAHDEDWKVRWAVAGNPNTPPDILDMLADDDRYGVSSRLVYNGSVRQDTLQRLLPRLSDSAALAAIERLDASRLSPTERLMKQWAGPKYNKILRDDTPGYVLSELHNVRNWVIRGAVVRHPNTWPETISKMTGDEKPEIGYSAIRRCDDPGILREAATSKDYNLRGIVGSNPHTPTDVLAKLARDSSRTARENVAANPSTPPEVLTQLGKSNHEIIHEALARNPSTPPETLLIVVLNEKVHRDVRRAAYDKLPDHMQAMIMLGGDAPDR